LQRPCSRTGPPPALRQLCRDPTLNSVYKSQSVLYQLDTTLMCLTAQPGTADRIARNRVRTAPPTSQQHRNHMIYAHVCTRPHLQSRRWSRMHISTYECTCPSRRVVVVSEPRVQHTWDEIVKPSTNLAIATEWYEPLACICVHVCPHFRTASRVTARQLQRPGSRAGIDPYTSCVIDQRLHNNLYHHPTRDHSPPCREYDRNGTTHVTTTSQPYAHVCIRHHLQSRRWSRTHTCTYDCVVVKQVHVSVASYSLKGRGRHTRHGW
jgi:hypothetical protein